MVSPFQGVDHMTASRDNAIKALENSVEAFMTHLREFYCDFDDVLGIDAVLIVGTQWIDQQGDRCGGISVLPRHGSQPYYATIGLLEAARSKIISTFESSQ